MAQQRVGWHGFLTESSSSFDVNGYESVNGGPLVPLLCVESCDLHSISIVPTSKSVPPGHGHDPYKSLFSTRIEGDETSPLVDS